MRSILVFGLGLVVATPLLADDLFKTKVDIWTIEQIFDTCVAYNRPDTEMKEMPIHALGLVREADGGVMLVVAFWPGAFGDDDNSLVITLGGVETKIGASEMGDSPQRTEMGDSPQPTQTVLTDALPEALVQSLSGPLPAGAMVKVRAEPSGVATTFDVSAVPAVMVELMACANGAKPY